MSKRWTMEKIILVKYGELTTKKDNRKTFIKILETNIKNKIDGLYKNIEKTLSRMYITYEDENEKEIINQLEKIFGIHSIVTCEKVNTNEEEIKNKILEILKNKNFKTFKISTKRSDKTFKYTSMEFNNIIGGLVLKNYNCKVDVHNPELNLEIEIRKEGTFIYNEEFKGLGGYPVGIQGKGLLMLSGGIDSPVAGYLALKRGVNIECLYFESPPHTSLNAKNKVLKLAEILNDYSGTIKVHIVPFTKIQEEIYKNIPGNYNITIMRRMMYRIAERFAKKRNCKIIVNGESIGQVASQTLNSMVVINSVTNMPVIRPVACLDKLEIIEISKKINTYDTSILPYEDCCTIFVPRHPIINPSLETAIEYEKNIDYENLITECIKNIETIKIKKQEKEELL
jgi:thiamine biosynthesis protein ThiI